MKTGARAMAEWATYSLADIAMHRLYIRTGMRVAAQTSGLYARSVLAGGDTDALVWVLNPLFLRIRMGIP